MAGSSERADAMDEGEGAPPYVAPTDVLIYIDTVAIVRNHESTTGETPCDLVPPIRIRSLTTGRLVRAFAVEIRGPSRLCYWPAGCPRGESPVHVAVVADEATVHCHHARHGGDSVTPFTQDPSESTRHEAPHVDVRTSRGPAG